MSDRTLTRVTFIGFTVILAIVLATPPAGAQSQATTGTIEGIVMDSTGAVLPGVTILLTNGSTGFQRELVTDENGRYRGLALPLGTYVIDATLTGFGRAVRQAVPLAVGQSVRIDFTLAPAGLKEEVSVMGGSPIVETTRSEQASLIDEKSVGICRSTAAISSTSSSSLPLSASSRGLTARSSASTASVASTTT